MAIFGKLNELFSGKPAEYDAQKYFDYAGRMGAKGNLQEAVNYYMEVCHHGDLGVKPYKAVIELCEKRNQWKAVLKIVAVYRKHFPTDKSGWIDGVERNAKQQLNSMGMLPTVVNEEDYINDEQPARIVRTSPVTTQKEQQKQSVAISFTDEAEHPTLGERYDKYCSTLPLFDFYNGDNEKMIPLDAEYKIRDFLDRLISSISMAKDFEKDNDDLNAELVYRTLIAHNVWEPEAYDGLIELYKRRGDEANMRATLQYSIDFFSKRRERMKKDFLNLAAQHNETALAQQTITKGEKVSYFSGLFTLYDPYPCIERWKKIL